MGYKVIIMPPAKRRLDMYVFYTIETLGNRQAAKAILADARETKKRLSMTADSLKICDNPILAKYGYRKIKFAKHKFITQTSHTPNQLKTFKFLALDANIFVH